jgi:glucose/arabinose dehydrogenase
MPDWLARGLRQARRNSRIEPRKERVQMILKSARWLLIGVMLATASPAAAQLASQLVASGFTQPVAFVQDPSQPNVQVVVEQNGHVRVVKDNAVLPDDFLDVSGSTVGSGEQGLLGLAFAPDYATSGRVYVNFTNLQGNTVIARFQRSAINPLQVDPSTRFDLVWPDGQAFITQPFANHNGGNIVFGPDGFLYIGMGDGGSGDDPGNRAQDPQSLLGKMLRIDVNVPLSDPRGYTVPVNNPFAGQTGVLGEIWDFGVRNPWRWSFDDPAHGGTGALVIGDVGQNSWEEVDYEPSGKGGRNYGWSIREGLHDEVTTHVPFSQPFTDPIFEYPHLLNSQVVSASVTGGYVYRGTALGPAFQGQYFFADIELSRVWSMALNIDAAGEATAGAVTDHTMELGAGANSPSSFGVDANGELYLVSYGLGAIYRIVLAPGGCATPDPFVTLGGGTCFEGNWLPPGFPIPGATPPPPPPPPPPSSTGCTTPDPFVTLGGGTCVDGNWFPPGFPIPGATPPPPPTPPPTTACTTPDPFVTLGGGTCVDGNWFPPGFPIPGGGGD